MIRAYDDNGNVVDLVKWEAEIRTDERKQILQKAYDIVGYWCKGYGGVNCIEANADAFEDLVEWLEKEIRNDNSTISELSIGFD